MFSNFYVLQHGSRMSGDGSFPFQSYKDAVTGKRSAPQIDQVDSTPDAIIDQHPPKFEQGVTQTDISYKTIPMLYLQ